MDKRKQTAARGRVGTSSKRKNSRAAKVGRAGRAEKSAGRTRKAATKGGAERRGLAWSEWLLIGILAAATLAIGLALATQLLDTPEEQAKKELAKIADDYYVEYVYPQLTEAGQKTEKLVDYATAGVPMTYLRQLLLYNNGEHQAQAGIFSAAGCDTNATGVRYYPVEPYGPHDYTASFVWQCDIME